MRRFMFSLLIFLLAFFALPAAAQEGVAQRNKEAFRSALIEASAGNPGALAEIHAEQYQSNQGGVTLQDSSRESLEMFANALFAALPDLQITPDVLIAQDDWVAGSITYSGTFSAPFSFPPFGDTPFAPTNQPVQWTEMNFLRFNDDAEIVEAWVISDPSVMLTQLGVFPPQPNGAPPPENPLTDPVGYKALSADELAATFTSGMEAANVKTWQDSVQDILTPDPIYANPYILRVQDVFIQEVRPGASSDGGFLGIIFSAMPDIKATPAIVVAEGDWVASLMTFSGTFTNEASLGPMTLKPTGGVVTWQLGFIDRFDAEGKVAEEWSADNPMPIMQGLGLMPPADTTPEAGS